MPYIKDREIINKWLNEIPLTPSSGELNYIITKLLLAQEPKNYEDYNRLMGIMTSCSMEFYRRKVVKYEIEKCNSNGDVYEKET